MGRIVVVTQHAGRHDGEYEENTIYTWHTDGSWERSYYSSYCGTFCRACGKYKWHSTHSTRCMEEYLTAKGVLNAEPEVTQSDYRGN